MTPELLGEYILSAGFSVLILFVCTVFVLGWFGFFDK